VATVVTPAIVLGTMRYGETSRIARIASRDLGIQSVIAKGALRPRSRFGAALHLLSEGMAHVIPSARSELHILAAFDLVKVRVDLAQRMDRFAAASLLAEVMLRYAPAASHPPSFDLLRDALNTLEVAPAAAVDTLALRITWHLISVLGFEPALERCARDGATVSRDREALFSTVDGGLLCSSCATGQSGPRLKPEDIESLMALVDPAEELPALDDPHLAAHRRLLARYIRYHLGDGSASPALEFWEQRPWVRA
jgi:DNA repair protein RecO (recombination protein O)